MIWPSCRALGLMPSHGAGPIEAALTETVCTAMAPILARPERRPSCSPVPGRAEERRAHARRSAKAAGVDAFLVQASLHCVDVPDQGFALGAEVGGVLLPLPAPTAASRR